MNRQQAVDHAADLVERMGNTEDLNKRGYKIDSWKPMSGPERADAIIRIAEALIDPDRPEPDLTLRKALVLLVGETRMVVPPGDAPRYFADRLEEILRDAGVPV